MHFWTKKMLETSRVSQDRFREESRKDQQLKFALDSEEFGVTLRSLNDYDRLCEELVEKALTCKVCSLVCTDFNRLEKHQDSDACRKQIAERDGVEYVPRAKEKLYCPICKQYYPRYGLKRHEESTKHLGNLKKIRCEERFECVLCHKVFKGPRAKRLLKRHRISGKKHLKRVAALKPSI